MPTNRQEMLARGWDELDILFVSGDAYIDHPAFGVPLLARFMAHYGYRVGILAQPDWRQPQAFSVMGRPRLFAAVSAGAMDSMVNHYTAARKLRRNDAYTPGGKAGARPNRAVIAYTAALKGVFKGVPVVVGGIEASLRRLAHFDYWTEQVRRSVLVDAKADLLIYGMAENTLLELARRCCAGESPAQIMNLPGTAVVCPDIPPGALELPSYEAVSNDPEAFGRAFRLAAEEGNPYSGRAVAQRHGNRWVLVNPPSLPLSQTELDGIYALPFSRKPHPGYRESIPAFEQIRFSVTSHRGCCGGCAFCAIASHQGKIIQSRSQASIVSEVTDMARDKGFRGTITDVGGPTANMYGMSCGNIKARKSCRRDGCLFPQPCRHLVIEDQAAASLLEKVRRLPGVKHVFVASGIRLDLLERQPAYFQQLLKHHVGGLLKVAPETLSDKVARIMRKPGAALFNRFLKQFRAYSRALDKRQSVVPYLIAGHPGCTLGDMVDTALFLKENGMRVEQVQEFTPTPGTLATCMYHTGVDPYSDTPVAVARSARERRLQKALLLSHLPENRDDVLQALQICGREDVAAQLLGAPPANMPKKAGPPRRSRRRPPKRPSRGK
nr:YgiQ family radical SAM protein [Syntrophotalea carbinolica]